MRIYTVHCKGQRSLTRCCATENWSYCHSHWLIFCGCFTFSIRPEVHFTSIQTKEMYRSLKPRRKLQSSDKVIQTGIFWHCVLADVVLMRVSLYMCDSEASFHCLHNSQLSYILYITHPRLFKMEDKDDLFYFPPRFSLYLA